jgi:hypothetical protein
MKRLMFVGLLFAFALLVVQPASADSAYQVGMNGSGSLMMSPVVYSGNFMFGLVGTWEITLDDSMWPSDADSTARFNYIWNHRTTMPPGARRTGRATSIARRFRRLLTSGSILSHQRA